MGAEPAPDAHPRRVLVVEDDQAVREGLGLILEEACEVVFADDGPPALELIRSTRIDAVLLDLGLPSMPGLEVLSEIRAIAPRLPVIVVTITGTAASVVLAMKLGAFDYITKPFRDEEVLARVREALEGVRPGESGDARARPWIARMTPSPRGRCLVLAGDVGLAATLRLILDRSFATDVAGSGDDALRALGEMRPDCVVCDDLAWDAGGCPFVRMVRRQCPDTAVLRITEVGGLSLWAPDGALLFDAVVPLQAGLGEIVRRVGALCGSARGPGSWGPTVSDRVASAMDLLQLRYRDHLTIEDVAREVAVSRGHLTECFREELGQNPGQYLLRLRVEVARLLLSRHAAKLDQVASLTGFRDSSHLSRAFLAVTGVRPGAYRRQHAS